MIEHIEHPKRKLIPSAIILAQFAKQKKTSPYQVCNNLKTTQYKRAYANVHLRIKELEEQKLIEKTDKTVPPHAATYYMLTPLGIQYLLLDQSWLPQSEYEHASEFVRLIKTYGDYLFFEIFAYPFFERRTLEHIGNYYVSHEIFDYFENCVKYMRRFSPPLDLEGYKRSVSDEQWIPLRKYIVENASEYLEKLIFVLVGYSNKKEKQVKIITLNKFDEYLVNDLILLARDRKFLRSVAQARKRLDTSYRKFMTYGTAEEH